MTTVKEDYVRDALGWVDDFRAAPGEGGLPLTRKLHIHALLRQGVTIRQLKEMKFPREFIKEVQQMMLDQEYPEND